MPEYVVDPAGDDTGPGDVRRPFATLGRAVRAAREAGAPAVVRLRAGRHVLTEPLEVTADGLVIEAYGYGTAEPEEAVVSGGLLVTGWEVDGGVWRTDVGDLDTRQLYAGGRRAERAAIAAVPGTVTATETGYVTNVTLDWHSPADVEFVYRGVYPWTEARCAVESVTTADGATTITMAQPAFARAHDLYAFAWEGYTQRGPGLPTRVENDPAFLTEPGTFALDRSRPGHHVLHYRPRSGETPEGTEVIAPVLGDLLRVTGATGVALRGLVLADATWPLPRADGFLHYHGNAYYLGGPVEKVTVVEGQAWVTVPGAASAIPARVRADDSTGLRIEDCRFTRLGATALGLTGGAGHVVRGCAFDTLAASGLTVTGARDVRIEDNRVDRIGLDYAGSPAIAINDTVACTVTHNEISDTPHCGIVAGPARATRITHNRITDTMTALADGGGVYVSGPQGDGPDNAALISGNVITDTRTPYNFGLYTDYGAAWATVEDNVVLRADNTAVLHVTPPLEHVVYRGNIWDADPVGADAVPPGVTYASNRVITDPHDPAITGVRERAGRRPAVLDA